ncbi:MAG: B-box zinc finger protein [Candidatus Thorarchaeota archaeon]
MTEAGYHPRTIMCPVCGGPVTIQYEDKVNRCEYCGSPVLGPSQSRDCVNHPGRLAKGVCRVCGDLICEECMERRVGDYGGKLLTIVNCRKPSCVKASEWAQPLDKEYQRLTNMDWADHIDNVILRVTGLGGIAFMILELLFILALFYIQYFTPWGQAGNIPYYFFPGDLMIILSIIGNFLSAIIMQVALQVYIHERQLSSGIILLVLLFIEVAYLVYRGLSFHLLSFTNTTLIALFLGGFLIAVILVLAGSLMAIKVGYKKYKQFKFAEEEIKKRKSEQLVPSA